MSHLLEVELHKQVWTRGLVFFPSSEASEVGLGVSEPRSRSMRPWRKALQQGRAEEEAGKETRSQSTISDLKILSLWSEETALHRPPRISGLLRNTQIPRTDFQAFPPVGQHLKPLRKPQN